MAGGGGQAGIGTAGGVVFVSEEGGWRRDDDIIFKSFLIWATSEINWTQ